jgi:hypothetical protein
MSMATAQAPPTPTVLAPEGPCCVTILGAGRSGTSAITRGMGAIGIDLGDRLRRGRGKNPTGFFEDNDVLRLSRRLKRAIGVRGDSVRLIEESEWHEPKVRKVHDLSTETLRRRFGDNPLWGYKYGRTLRFLPFWMHVWEDLGLDMRYVLALRNPMSVARSRERLNPTRGTQENSDLEWLVNIVPYLHLARSRPMVVIDYDRVMADPSHELERMAAGLGLPIEDRSGVDEYCNEFLRPAMRHSRFTIDDLAGDPRIHRLVREAYRWLYRLATDEIRTGDAQFWSEWSQIAAQLEDLRPVLRQMERLKAEARAAAHSPFGPLQVVPDLWRRARGRQ